MDGAKVSREAGTRCSKRIKEKQMLNGVLASAGRSNGNPVGNGVGAKHTACASLKKQQKTIKYVNGDKKGKRNGKPFTKPVQGKKVEAHKDPNNEDDGEIHPPSFAMFSTSALFMCFADEEEHQLINMSNGQINFELEPPEPDRSKDDINGSEVSTNGESTKYGDVQPESPKNGTVSEVEDSLKAENSGSTNKCSAVEPKDVKKALPKLDCYKSGNDHLVNSGVEPKAPRKWLSYLSGLVKEVPPPGFNTIINSPIYMYRRGPETTGQSLEEIQQAVSSGLHGRLIFLTGPVPGWGLPEMKYLGNGSQCEKEQEPYALKKKPEFPACGISSQPNEISTQEPVALNKKPEIPACGKSSQPVKISTTACGTSETMLTKLTINESSTSEVKTATQSTGAGTAINRSRTLLKNPRRLRISEVVKCQTPKGEIKYEALKDTPSLMKQAAKLKKTLLKKRKLETGNQSESDEVTICEVVSPPNLVNTVSGDIDCRKPVRLFSNPSVDLRLNQCSAPSSHTEEFYSSAYSYLTSAFTILAYRTGLYPNNYYEWRKVFGILVPFFPRNDKNFRYVRNFTKGIITSLKKKQFEGAVFLVTGKDATGCRLTLHRYIIKITGSSVMSKITLTTAQEMLREMTYYASSLDSLLQTDQIIRTPCPWLSAWRLSVGVKGDRKSTSPDALLRKPSDALNFPWKRQRTMSQAYKMGLVYPPVHLRPKNFIANELRKLKELEKSRKSTPTPRSTSEGVNNTQVKQTPTMEKWRFDFSSSSDEMEDEISKPSKPAEEITIVSDSGEVMPEVSNKIGKDFKKSNCSNKRATLSEERLSLRKKIGFVETIQSFTPRLNVVFSIHRRDFRSPDKVFTKERLVHAAKKEKNFLKSGTVNLDSELVEPHNP